VAAKVGLGVSASWDAEILGCSIIMLELWNALYVLDRNAYRVAYFNPFFQCLSDISRFLLDVQLLLQMIGPMRD
jgi:hypothetical protein